MDFSNQIIKDNKLFDNHIGDCSDELVDDTNMNTNNYGLFFSMGRYENHIDHDDSCVDKIDNILSNNKDLEQHIGEFASALDLLESITNNKKKIKMMLFNK